MAYQPAKLDLVLQRGTFGSIAAIIYDFVDLNNEIIPLADKKIVLTAKGGRYSLVKSSADDGFVIDPVANTATWSPSASEVRSAPSIPVEYTVELIFADGSAQRFIEGMFSVAGLT